MPHIYKVNVETNTQLIAGNPESVAEAWDKYFTHQSGRYPGIGVGQALGQFYRSLFDVSANL